jgi:hypothetical protein
MVFPQYPNHQPEANPWPPDYDDHCHRRGKRSPVLAASVAGLIAVLVLAVGILLGLQLSQPDPEKPLATSPPPSVTASTPSGTVPTENLPRLPERLSERARTRPRDWTGRHTNR